MNKIKGGRSVAVESIGKRDADRVVFNATHQNKHQRDRQRANKVVWVVIPK